MLTTTILPSILLSLTSYLSLTQPAPSHQTPPSHLVPSLSILHFTSPTPTPTIPPIPKSKTLPSNYHIFQTFNNCGPASLSLALSYFNIHKTQEELGAALRPYQNPTGDNDDKSVTFSELAQQSQQYGLLTYHRPNGDIQLLQQFIAHDIPILTRTWLSLDEDIGHYRLIKGYDNQTQTLIQDDTYQDKNLEFSYDTFNQLWQKFNYEYLVLIPPSKKQIAEQIIREDLDPQTAWQKTKTQNEKILLQNPNDIYARFNLSLAHYYLSDYQQSITEYEKIETQLPWRTLWYQAEPIYAYYELGHYDKILSLTGSILNNQNRAFSELYLLRGKIYLKQEKKDLARQEFQNAIYYNQNFKPAQDTLKALQ